MVTERAYGQLKSRWRVLYRKLECRPDSMKLATLACIALHNICITTKDSLPAQLDLSIDPFTQKKRSREEIRDLLQMCNCPKREGYILQSWSNKGGSDQENVAGKRSKRTGNVDVIKTIYLSSMLFSTFPIDCNR